MAAAPQIVSLPEFFELSDGMQVVVTAVDATTNAVVSGVVISGVSLSVDPDTDTAGTEILPPILDPAFFAGEAA